MLWVGTFAKLNSSLAHGANCFCIIDGILSIVYILSYSFIIIEVAKDKGFSLARHFVMTCNNKELQECLFDNKSVYADILVLQDKNKRKRFFLLIWRSEQESSLFTVFKVLFSLILQQVPAPCGTLHITWLKNGKGWREAVDEVQKNFIVPCWPHREDVVQEKIHQSTWFLNTFISDIQYKLHPLMVLDLMGLTVVNWIPSIPKS